MPQPFLGFSLQSVPLAEIAHPFRGHLLPCSHPPACRRAALESLSPPASTDAHAFTRLPGLPRRLWLPFPRTRRHASRSTWGPSMDAPFRQLHLLRSLDPPASPFAQARVAPDPRPLLSWVSAPLKRSPTKPRSLGPARPRGPNTHPHPKDRARDPKDRWPPEPGETRPTPRVSASRRPRRQTPTRCGPDRTASRRRLLLP
jgi:hypothetical protein